MHDDDELPAPFVSAEVDLRGMPGFMLNVERLLQSELVALGTPEECWAAFMLWCRAWQQFPAGSLPNDERVLASFSGAGRRWRKVREMALHGFVRCSDGRLYHKVLSQEVLVAWRKRQTYRNDQERLRRWREDKRNAFGNGAGNADETRFNTVSETRSETPVEMPLKRVDRDRDSKKEKPTLSGGQKESVSESVSERVSRRSQIPPNWTAEDQDRAYAVDHAQWASERISTEAEHFRDHHRSKGSLFADHHAAWRTWVRNAATFQRNNGHAAAKPNGKQPPLTQERWDAMSDAERREFIPGYIRPI